jgi:hypothetical protein
MRPKVSVDAGCWQDRRGWLGKFVVSRIPKWSDRLSLPERLHAANSVVRALASKHRGIKPLL